MDINIDRKWRSYGEEDAVHDCLNNQTGDLWKQFCQWNCENKHLNGISLCKKMLKMSKIVILDTFVCYIVVWMFHYFSQNDKNEENVWREFKKVWFSNWDSDVL